MIDIETTGLPQVGAEIITVGIITGNLLRIMQRTNEDGSFFKDFARTVIFNCPRPYHAFNKHFEEQMLGVSLDSELQSKLYEKKSFAISIPSLVDPFHGEGIEVIQAWSKYKSTGKDIFLFDIMSHNESDLLLECCLLLARKHEKEVVVLS